MTVEEVIDKLMLLDKTLPVIIGGDGAYLGDVEGVFAGEESSGKPKRKVIVIAEWKQE